MLSAVFRRFYLFMIASEGINDTHNARFRSSANEVKVHHGLDGPVLHAPYDGFGIYGEKLCRTCVTLFLT